MENVDTGEEVRKPVSFENGCEKADWGDPPFDFAIVCCKYCVNIKAFMPHLSETTNWYLVVDPVKKKIEDVKMLRSKGYPVIDEQGGCPTIYCVFEGQNHYELLVPKQETTNAKM